MSRFARPIAVVLPALAFACSSGGDGEAVGTVRHELREAELPKSADLDYTVRSGEDHWGFSVAIRPYRDGRRISVEQRLGVMTSKATAVTSRIGAIDPQSDREAAWLRVDGLSTPGALGVGKAWKPFAGVQANDTGNKVVINEARSYIVVDAWEEHGGLHYRAVFNVRPHVAKLPSSFKGEWPFADSVYGVGVAEWFMPEGASTSYLLSSAEYTFLTPSRPASFAVANANELSVRLGQVRNLLTLTCLEKGPANVLAARGARLHADTAFALPACAQ